MNITPPKPLSSKSIVRSISGLSRTKDLKLTDVTNDDEDGKMMMDDVPVLHSFISPDKTMTTQDILAYLLGLMCGVVGANNHFYCYYY